MPRLRTRIRSRVIVNVRGSATGSTMPHELFGITLIGRTRMPKTGRLLRPGSAIVVGAEEFWGFDIEGGRVRATPGGWQGGCYVLESEAAVDVCSFALLR